MEQQQIETLAIDHVLLVDDDPILCAIVERHFKKRGTSQIVVANDGLQALQVLDNGAQPPDFILCDLNMPNMDGLEFLRHLESRRFGGAIGILSGEDESVVALAESLAQAHKLNVVGKLNKPLNAHKLDTLIAKAREELSAPSQQTNALISDEDLYQGIIKRQIIAFHQPKVHAQTGQFVGTEALARWAHPEWGIVPPSLFISLAEETGLIERLTFAVFDHAISDLQKWKLGGINACCSINLSPSILTNINLPDEIAGRVDVAGLAREQIVLEITEGSLLQKDRAPMEVMARLRVKGFDLSVDDFGTGHSNIETLRNFPFTELKIDRSFISKMLDDAFAAESVRTSVELSKQLNLRMVAEGVETRRVCDAVKRMGIHHIQGFLFGKPMPGDELPRWLNEYRVGAGQMPAAAQVSPAPTAAFPAR